MRFKPGSSGRPAGTRNKLNKALLTDLLAEWEEGGRAAIKIMRIERPSEFVKAAFGTMPRELVFENSVSELDDDEIDNLILHIRERLLTKRNDEPMLIENKPIIEAVNVRSED